jgi:hypothetical protein
VSYRPLVFVSGLTVGDFLLWNWSLHGNHDVLALIAGLTLPPLAVASMWLLAVTLARAIAHHARPLRRSESVARAAEKRRRRPARAGAATRHEDARAGASRSSRRIAA